MLEKLTLSQLEQYLSKAAWILKEAWNTAQKSESVFKQKLKEFII
jgi:hypothetical protein